MSDLEYLYAVLVAFYFWECTHWIRRASAPFVAWAGRSFRLSQSFFVGSGRDGGLHFASPLPLLGTFFVASEWPFALSPVGVANRAGTTLHFADTPQFSSRRHRLRVGRQSFAEAGSPAEARRLAGMLNTLVKTSEAGREGLIGDWMRSALDSASVAGRLSQFTAAARVPGIMATALLLAVFFTAPLIIWRLGLGPVWPWLLGGLAMVCIVNSIVFFLAHKRLYPDLEDERFAHFLMVLLFPPAGMRTRDMLSRPLLEAFHPLATARVLCAPAQFQMIARRIARESHWPPARPSSKTTGAGEIREWQDRAMRRAVEAFVARHDLSLDQLVTPPEHADPGSHSYCPRCHAQFTQVKGTCSDCGVELVRF